MKSLSIACVALALSASVLSESVFANIRKKTGAPNRGYIRTVYPDGRSWDVWIDGFETNAQAAATYQAIGIKIDRSTKAGGLVAANWPSSFSFVRAIGSNLRLLRLRDAKTRTTTTLAMAQSTKLGPGAMGVMAYSGGGQTAGTKVALKFHLRFTSVVTSAEVCAMLAKLEIGIDECTPTGALKGTQWNKLVGYPCHTFKAGSNTLPAGFEDIEGSDFGYAGWNPYIWTPTYDYIPGRIYYSYASAAFPWNPSTSKKINELRVRQDGWTTQYIKQSLHCAMWMSIDGFDPKNPRHSWTPDVCHGRNKQQVLPKAWINCATSPKAPPIPTAFDTALKFSKPYIVSAGAKNLILEFRGYATSVTQSKQTRWAPDANHYYSTLDRGSLTTRGTQCPATPAWTINNNISSGGTEFTNVIDTKQANLPVVAILGPALPTGIPIGSGCTLYVNPLLFLTGATNSTGKAEFFWGLVPDLPPGSKISYQFVVLKAGFPWQNTVGLSQAGEYRFGTGHSNNDVLYSSVYLFGGANIDTASSATYHYPRAVIFEVR